MHSKKLVSIVEAALADMKARDVRVIDVRKLTSVTDFMVIASGTSDRHVRSIADRVVVLNFGHKIAEGRAEEVMASEDLLPRALTLANRIASQAPLGVPRNR